MHARWRRLPPRALAVPIAALTIAGFAAAPAAALTISSTTLVSVGGNQDSFSPALNSDGRFVAFASNAKLVPGDIDVQRDIYVRDTVAGSFELISTNTTLPADNPDITPDGRYVVFDANGQLAPQDTDAVKDVYRYDRQTGVTELISRGRLAGIDTFSSLGEAVQPTVSNDGNRIAFESAAADLVDGDSNGHRDAFVRDVAGGFTFRASVRDDEGQANGGDSTEPAISGDGNHVAFTSSATNLAIGDAEGDLDVFIRDTRSPGTTRWASRPAIDGDDNGPSTSPTISGNGQRVAFTSGADLNAAGGELICPGPEEGRTPDVYLFDLLTGALTVASASSSAGVNVKDPAGEPSMSADGTRIAFTSRPLTIITCGTIHPDPNDPVVEPPETDIGDGRIFLRDTTNSTTTRVDTNNVGQAGNADSDRPDVSSTGDSVGYDSLATNLSGGDPAVNDVFLARLQ